MSVLEIVGLVALIIISIPVGLLVLVFLLMIGFIIVDWAKHHKHYSLLPPFYDEWVWDAGKAQALEQKREQKQMQKLRRQYKISKDIPNDWLKEIA